MKTTTFFEAIVRKQGAPGRGHPVLFAVPFIYGEGDAEQRLAMIKKINDDGYEYVEGPIRIKA